MRPITATDATIGVMAVAILVAGAVSLGRLDDRSSPPTPTTSTTPDATTPPEPVEVPPPGHILVTGSVTAIAVDAQALPVIETPLTIDVEERGVGEAQITQAIVDGRRATITWTTGRPLMISAAPSIDPAARAPGPIGVVTGPATLVEIDGPTVRVSLDGPVHELVPGRYRIDAPVAVSQGSLSRPEDAVEFTADEQTLLTTLGEAHVDIPAAAMVIDGPGTLALDAGDGPALTITRPDGSTADVLRLGAGPGAYRLEIAPAGARWSVRLLAAGPPRL